MKIHEICSLFPQMSDEEIRELAADIKENGQYESIWTHGGMVIDGRSRVEACKIAGVKVSAREWSGNGSLTAFVVALNLKRRHLTASQRSVAAVAIKKKLEEEIKEELKGKQRDGGRRGGKSAGRGRPKEQDRESGNNTEHPKTAGRDARKEAAKSAGVSEKYVSMAERLKEESPDLLAEVQAGRMTLPEAIKQLGPGTANPVDGEEDPTHVSLTLSLDPGIAAAELAAHFTGDALVQLVGHLAKLAGIRIQTTSA